MIKLSKLKIYLIGILTFSAGILILISCYIAVSPRDVKHAKSAAADSRRLNFGFEDFTITEYVHDGLQEKKFTIQGKKLGMESKKLGTFRVALAKAICFKDIEVIFYENNMPVSSLSAKNAVSNIPFDEDSVAGTLTGEMDFSGGIILMTGDKRTLTCDRLRWDKGENCLFASGNCVLGYEGKRVRADLIKTDVKLKTFTVSKDKNRRLWKIQELLNGRI